MGFLPAGYPTPDAFTAVARAAFAAGLDALEVGMPGPASALDGPLIKEAAIQASHYVTTPEEALKLAAASRSHADDTMIALAHASLFRETNEEDFLDLLGYTDVDAYLLPEHPMDEQLALGAVAQRRGIEPVLFLHLEKDLQLIAASELEEPIIYLQSADLHTGGMFDSDKARERLSELSVALRSKPHYVCVGFGVRGHREVKTVMDAGADGAIIGTRFVQAAARGASHAAALVDEVAPALIRPGHMRA